MKDNKPLLSVLVTATVAVAQATALADTAANIQKYNNLTAVTYDGGGVYYPIVSAILSRPGSLDGYTYNNWAYLAADPTGSIDMFYSSTAAGPAANYPNPTVGDSIYVTAGTYSVFNGIPEIENNAVQAINVFGPGSPGNPPYNLSPVLTTIPTINVGLNSYGLNLAVQGGISLAGNYLQLNNVTIGGNLVANFPTHSNSGGVNGNWTIADQHGNSMTLFFWASSYSTDGAMAGQPIPTGPVDMTGFVDDFTSGSGTNAITTAEFVMTSYSVVPEPSAMNLCGIGSALAWVCYRWRKKA